MKTIYDAAILTMMCVALAGPSVATAAEVSQTGQLSVTDSFLIRDASGCVTISVFLFGGMSLAAVPGEDPPFRRRSLSRCQASIAAPPPPSSLVDRRATSNLHSTAI